MKKGSAVYDNIRLMLPGPTPVPPSVLQAQALPMINHRGKEFSQLLSEAVEGVKWVYQTKGDVLLLTSSGTGGLESAIVNVLSPGDPVLALVTGEFGERFAKIAETFGASVDRLKSETGKAIETDEVKKQLTQKKYKALLITHNETSTAVMNPIEEIAKAAKERGILVLVDGITSVGVVDLPVDEWGLDIVVSGSQKGFMMPPGLAFVSVSPDAWKAHQEAKMPRFYWDYSRFLLFADKGQTPWTPAISTVYALHRAVELLREEGLENIFARHELLTKMVRAGVRAMGLKLLVEEDRIASRAVTAVFPPDGISPHQLRAKVQEKFGIVLAGGQGGLKDSIFRIGHIGNYRPADILIALAALEVVLREMGYEAHGGVEAAQNLMSPVPA
ncbi:MAG TPA: aminotransferase [Cyanobacteria bacterium UBA8530]|nr:aminotransferase [Cyanobacteria bacterium UBA8530]